LKYLSQYNMLLFWPTPYISRSREDRSSWMFFIQVVRGRPECVINYYNTRTLSQDCKILWTRRYFVATTFLSTPTWKKTVILSDVFSTLSLPPHHPPLISAITTPSDPIIRLEELFNVGTDQQFNLRAKSQEIVFTDKRRKRRLQHLPPLANISWVDAINILVVTVTHTLSMHEHVNNVLSSCSQSVHALQIPIKPISNYFIHSRQTNSKHANQHVDTARHQIHCMR